MAPTRADVLSTFAALRPLHKSGSGPTHALPRDHVITVSPTGLITITGGKWTTARQMAEEVIDRAAALAGLPTTSCRTAALPVAYPLPASVGVPDDSFVIAAARTTMACSVEDVLARRTRLLYLDARAATEAAPRVAAVLAPALDRDAAWQAAQVKSFRALARRHLL